MFLFYLAVGQKIIIHKVTDMNKWLTFASRHRIKQIMHEITWTDLGGSFDVTFEFLSNISNYVSI